MTNHKALLTGVAIALLTIGSAQAGPCNNGKMTDAGTGPTPVHTGQSTSTTTTTGAATTTQHPPTSAMNRAAAGSATSSEDVQKQTQGQPTAAQQAQGAKTDERC